MDEIIATQPMWLQLWLNVLMIGGLGIPVVLLIWKESRIAGVAGIIAAVLSGLGVYWLFEQMGYVKLLGLPHVILWTPLAVYLIVRLRNAALRTAPRILMIVMLAVILISLAFDYTDCIRWLLGERTPITL